MIETPATIPPITGAILVVRVGEAGVADSVGGTELEDNGAVIESDELPFSDSYGRR